MAFSSNVIVLTAKIAELIAELKSIGNGESIALNAEEISSYNDVLVALGASPDAVVPSDALSGEKAIGALLASLETCRVNILNTSDASDVILTALDTKLAEISLKLGTAPDGVSADTADIKTASETVVAYQEFEGEPTLLGELIAITAVASPPDVPLTPALRKLCGTTIDINVELTADPTSYAHVMVNLTYEGDNPDGSTYSTLFGTRIFIPGSDFQKVNSTWFATGRYTVHIPNGAQKFNSPKLWGLAADGFVSSIAGNLWINQGKVRYFSNLAT